MKILVPVDGSPASIRAVKLAVDQVKGLPEASLVLVNVQNFSGLSLPEGAEISADEALKDVVATCREAASVLPAESMRTALFRRPQAS